MLQSATVPFCSPTQHPAELKPEEARHRIKQLREGLVLCPGDIGALGELATLMERVGEIEGAFAHWRQILAYDANNLRAREGIARCRQRAGRT